MTEKGRFIVFEGVDGAGKSTQINLLKKHLAAKSEPVLLVREPGSTSISEDIRMILLNQENSEMVLKTELLLYMASRAQMVAQVVQPAISSGTTVICDRYLYSSIAYQGYAGGLDIDFIERLGDFTTNTLVPDIVFIIDIDHSKGLDRVGSEKDRVESRSFEFHQKVRSGFLSIARSHQELMRVIDGDQAVENIFNEIREHIDAL